MVEAGEADALVAERVWKELSRGLMTVKPSRMLDVLHQSGALARVMPELREPAAVGADVDRAATLGLPLASRYALMCRLTPEREALGRRLRVPTECNDCARLLPEMLSGLEAVDRQDGANAQLALIERADALRKPERFMDLIQAAAVLRTVDDAAWQARVDAARGVDAGAIARCAGDPAHQGRGQAGPAGEPGSAGVAGELRPGGVFKAGRVFTIGTRRQTAAQPGARLFQGCRPGSELAEPVAAREAAQRAVMPRPTASTLNSSPISASDSSFCTGATRARIGGRIRGVELRQQLHQAGVHQEARLRGIAQHLQPAACAASAMAVKSTWAVMSCRPGAVKGSPWAWCRRWHISVPPARCGW